jgi:adenylate kinase family enzyme
MSLFSGHLHPKRIMIFGIPGSGKSTFAAKLSQQLGLPLFHLDKYFFTRDWQERDYDEFLLYHKEERSHHLALAELIIHDRIES